MTPRFHKKSVWNSVSVVFYWMNDETGGPHPNSSPRPPPHLSKACNAIRTPIDGVYGRRWSLTVRRYVYSFAAPKNTVVLSSASASAIGSVWEAARRTERRGAQARGGRGQVTCAPPRGRLLLVRAPPRVVAHGRAELAQEPHEHLRTRADVTMRAHSLGFHFLIYTGVMNSKVTLSTFPLSRLDRER